MNPNTDYLEINKQLWDKRTEAHLHSEFYDVKGFLAGNTSLNPIELELLGDISGKSILHLQCHFQFAVECEFHQRGSRREGTDKSARRRPPEAQWLRPASRRPGRPPRLRRGRARGARLHARTRRL